MKKPVFWGCCTALATPFLPSGDIDFGALGIMIDRQIESGVSSLALCATTGEGATLSEFEFERVISFAVERNRRRIPLLAGAGKNCTRTTLRLSLLAQSAGADALLLCNPYYNKSTQSGIIRHFEYIADRVQLPILLYNVPSRTGMAIAPETCAVLAAHPRIVGIKEAGGDISRTARMMALCPEDFWVYSGNDEQTLAILALGGAGVISTSANIAPREMARLCSLWQAGDIGGARRAQLELLPLIDALFCETNPIPLKYALSRLGLCSGEVRLPLTEPSENAKAKVDNALLKFSAAAEKE